MSVPAAGDERRRAALTARIARRYRTVTEELTIGDLAIRFTRVANPDQVLEAKDASDAAGVVTAWQPFWAETWESAWAVAAALLREDLHGQRVLDLGCGLGLSGAVAAARGAHVMLVDAAPPALLFARLNCWPWRARVQFRRLDWRHERLPHSRFQRIIGSDILYDREDWPFLERFWREHLAPTGGVLLGEPGRGTGDEIAAWLGLRGWQVQVSSAPGYSGRRPLRLFRAVLAGSDAGASLAAPAGAPLASRGEV